MFCRSLFVLLYFLFWPLHCVSFFDWRLLITSLWYLQTLLISIVVFIRHDKQPSNFQYENSVGGGRVMVFNATFNNISVISWRSVLLVKETGVLVENHHMPQVIDKLYHIEYISPWSGFELTILVAIGTGCTGSCRSNYSTITIMTTPDHSVVT